MTGPAPTAKPKFPATFWTANTIELFERAAYYSMASFMVIYLKESLGMSPEFATFLNGSLLWGIIYFMPILSGTLADKFGYRRSLSVSFVLIAIGYFIMGNVQRLWPGIIGRGAAEAVDFTVPVVLGIVLIGLGGSIVKPCIAGTVQKTAGTRATLAFGIFYMVINIGSITGRSVSYFIRTTWGIPAIFAYAATSFALIGLLVTLFVYREPQYVSDGIKDGQVVKKRTLGQALAGIFVVLGNVRFVFLILVLGLFWFLYIQLYNLMPLFMRYVDPDAPMELYTLANPIMIVAFQLLITRLVKRVDIRDGGSGHVTTTNTIRQAGWLPGVLVLLLDVAKGFLPVYVALRLGQPGWAVAISAGLAVAGHPVAFGQRVGVLAKAVLQTRNREFMQPLVCGSGILGHINIIIGFPTILCHNGKGQRGGVIHHVAHTGELQICSCPGSSVLVNAGILRIGEAGQKFGHIRQVRNLNVDPE